MAHEAQDIEIRYWNSLRKGDRSSLAWLYNRYFKHLYNYGRKIHADKKSLEDAIHDLFVDLWRFHDNLSPTTSVRFYLYRSLRRRLVRNDSLKNFLYENREVIGEDLLDTVACQEQRMIDGEAQVHRTSHIRKLLDNLSPRQYEAMVLRFYDELSFAEIAVMLNVNEQSARNLIQRAVAQLKQYSKLFLTWPFFLIC